MATLATVAKLLPIHLVRAGIYFFMAGTPKKLQPVIISVSKNAVPGESTVVDGAIMGHAYLKESGNSSECPGTSTHRSNHE
jgi:hypothetical protein